MEGLSRHIAIDLATEAPIKSGPLSPGPDVYAIPPILFKSEPDSLIVRFIRGINFFR